MNGVFQASKSGVAPDSKRSSSDDHWYDFFDKAGVHYGPSFQTLSQIQGLQTEHARARIALKPTNGLMIQESAYLLHPATLDGCLQLSYIAAQNGVNMTRTYLPFEINHLKIWNHTTCKTLNDHATIEGSGKVHGLRQVKASFEVFDDGHKPLVQASVSFISVEGGFTTNSPQPKQPLQRLIWMPVEERGEEAVSNGVPISQTDPLWLVRTTAQITVHIC